MHFTPAQLRTLNRSFETERPEAVAPPEPTIDPYGEHENAVTMLSLFTSEAHVVRMSAVPRSNADEEPIDEIHQRVLRTTNSTESQIQLTNYRKTLKVIPPKFIDINPATDTAKLTNWGDTALAMGGTLLQGFSIDHRQYLRHWTGLRLARGADKQAGRSPAQLHKLHIVSSLLPRKARLTALELSSTGVGFNYRNALQTLERLLAFNILVKKQVQRNPVRFGWELNPRSKPATRFLLGTLIEFTNPDQAVVSAGLAKLDQILSADQGRLATSLYRRGYISCGDADIPSPITFNDRLAVMYNNLPSGTLLSASEIGAHLGEKITVDRMQRQVDRPGCRARIECVATLHGSDYRYRFRLRPLNRELV